MLMIVWIFRRQFKPSYKFVKNHAEKILVMSKNYWGPFSIIIYYWVIYLFHTYFFTIITKSVYPTTIIIKFWEPNCYSFIIIFPNCMLIMAFFIPKTFQGIFVIFKTNIIFDIYVSFIYIISTPSFMVKLKL